MIEGFQIAADLVSKLNYGTSAKLEDVAKRVKASREIGVNIVREHPYYSRLPNCKVEEKIKEFEDRLTNQKYAGLHTSMTKSRDCLRECVKTSESNDASLHDANTVYCELLPMLSSICHTYSNPLQLSDRCSALIKKFHDCWDSRHGHLKHFEMVDAEAMLAEGIRFLEQAVKSGQEEASAALQDVITEETKTYLKNFETLVKSVEDQNSASVKNYTDHDQKLGDDLKTLEKTLESESSTFDATSEKHRNSVLDLKGQIKVNHEKQEELKRQLALLGDEEAKLLEKHENENTNHLTNTKNHNSRRDTLLVTKETFMKLKKAAEGCKDVMSKIQSSSHDLSDCCIKTKKNTNNLMMNTHKTAFERYREALVTLLVMYKVQIRDSKQNIDYLQSELDKLKSDLERAVHGALNVVVDQKRAEVGKYQRGLVQQRDIIKASQDRIESLEIDLAKCDKELEAKHQAKPEPISEVYNKRLEMIETRWKSDGLGADHIAKLSLLPDPELRSDNIKGLDGIRMEKS